MVLYHAILVAVGAFGVVLLPSGVGVVAILVAIGLALLYWTTGWMFFIG